MVCFRHSSGSLCSTSSIDISFRGEDAAMFSIESVGSVESVGFVEFVGSVGAAGDSSLGVSAGTALSFFPQETKATRIASVVETISKDFFIVNGLIR